MKKWEKPMIQELNLSYTMEEGIDAKAWWNDDGLCYCDRNLKNDWHGIPYGNGCGHQYNPYDRKNKEGTCPPYHRVTKPVLGKFEPCS